MRFCQTGRLTAYECYGTKQESWETSEKIYDRKFIDCCINDGALKAVVQPTLYLIVAASHEAVRCAFEPTIMH